ncbi:hypothetical protein Pcinc_039326 [Petrolisthes cinctipes]|uniref:Uncharacterized protein n=1 Tax=Petrolisthes cinctipes TaxID=88211 RepID=A0AAE1BNR6_PETCI|nr:hypothetical protein Pcinc_039326 [Petrolisthes cinctipes]
MLFKIKFNTSFSIPLGTLHSYLLVTLRHMNAEVSVCPDGLLHFNDTVIIHAPVVTPRKGAPRPPIACTLAATPSRECLLKNVYYDVPITASPDHHKPLVKNVFTIRP